MYLYNETIMPLPNQGFAAQRANPNIRSRMASGRARQRPGFTKSIKQADFTFELNRLQYAIFIAFWTKKLNNGLDWFLIRLPGANDVNLTVTKVRFISDLSEQHLPGQNWNISAKVEFYDSEAEITPDIVDLITCYTLEEIAELQAGVGNLNN